MAAWRITPIPSSNPSILQLPNLCPMAQMCEAWFFFFIRLKKFDLPNAPPSFWEVGKQWREKHLKMSYTIYYFFYFFTNDFLKTFSNDFPVKIKQPVVKTPKHELNVAILLFLWPGKIDIFPLLGGISAKGYRLVRWRAIDQKSDSFRWDLELACCGYK